MLSSDLDKSSYVTLKNLPKSLKKNIDRNLLPCSIHLSAVSLLDTLGSSTSDILLVTSTMFPLCSVSPTEVMNFSKAGIVPYTALHSLSLV